MLMALDGPAVIDAKARYWLKIAIFAPVRCMSLSDYYHNVWYGKTTMLWLHDGEKLCLFVSIEYKNVTNIRTDRRTDR